MVPVGPTFESVRYILFSTFFSCIKNASFTQYEKERDGLAGSKGKLCLLAFIRYQHSYLPSSVLFLPPLFPSFPPFLPCLQNWLFSPYTSPSPPGSNHASLSSNWVSQFSDFKLVFAPNAQAPRNSNPDSGLQDPISVPLGIMGQRYPYHLIPHRHLLGGIRYCWPCYAFAIIDLAYYSGFSGGKGLVNRQLDKSEDLR